MITERLHREVTKLNLALWQRRCTTLGTPIHEKIWQEVSWKIQKYLEPIERTTGRPNFRLGNDRRAT